MVVDTSILLAIFFNETHGSWAASQMEKHKGSLRMSTVNLAEACILLEDRQPQLYQRMEEAILSSGIRFVAPSVEDALIASKARLRYPINLGDCFAYALAKREDCGILTLDTAFKKTDLDVLLPT